MVAPAAPTIQAKTNGNRIYVRWLPVANAASYNLYIDAVANPSALEANIPAASQLPDGWFGFVTLRDFAGPNWVHLTAVNAGSEESVASNEVDFNLRGRDGGAADSTDPGGSDDGSADSKGNVMSHVRGMGSRRR